MTHGEEMLKIIRIFCTKGRRGPCWLSEREGLFIPLENVVTLGVVQIPFISKLGEISSIKGHNGVNLVRPGV